MGNSRCISSACNVFQLNTPPGWKASTSASMEGLYLLIGLLLSHLSSSTFKGAEPLGRKVNFQELCQVEHAANQSYKMHSSPLSPCCEILMIPTPIKSIGQVGGNSSKCLQGGIQLWMETQTCRSLHVCVSMCTRCLNSHYICGERPARKVLILLQVCGFLALCEMFPSISLRILE